MSHAENKAIRHLWPHFSAPPTEAPIIIERGEGVYVWDQHGKRYLDALAGLFVVQVGHGRQELANAAGKQAETMAYYPIWGYTHRPAIDMAAKLAELAPGDLNRVFFTTGGSEAVESAWKLARQYHQLRGEPERRKVIARETTYHGTTLGALSITGIPALRAQFEPLIDGVSHVAKTDQLHCTMCHGTCNLMCADEFEDAIVREGPETVAAVYLEPVQNSGGCFTPPPGYFARVRDICDRYGVLLVSDEVICAFGRVGAWFGAERYDYLPDMITFAKGSTSGYSPLGGVIVRDSVAEPFVEHAEAFTHGITFAGHPVSCAVGLANLEIMESERLPDHVAANEAAFRSVLEGLLDHPMAVEVRGAGYFFAVELVKDKDTMEPFTAEESNRLVKEVLKPAMLERGMLARADNRGAPILQYSPPLIAGPDEFAVIADVSAEILDVAAAAMGVGS